MDLPDLDWDRGEVRFNFDPPYEIDGSSMDDGDGKPVHPPNAIAIYIPGR